MTMENENKIETNINAENKKDRKNITFDELLISAGELGRYQFLLVFSTFPFYLFGVCVYFSQLFMTQVPAEHWCWIPELSDLTEMERRKLAIPKDNYDKNGFSRCESYDANWTEVLLTGKIPNNTKTVLCQNGWEFDRTHISYETISSVLGWVCEKKSYQATAQLIFFAGSVLGGFIIGWLADRYGRVPATVASNILGFLGGVSSTFALTYTEFVICRFIMGMAFDTCMMIPFLIVLEYTAPKYKSLLANASFAFFFSVFATSYPFVALACGHWKILSLVSSIPLVFAILTPMFFPESPRWLLSKGRVEEVINRVQIIAKVNKKEIPTNLLKDFRDAIQTKQKEESVSICELFKSPLMRKNFIFMCLVYMVCQTIFDCLFRNLEQLQFNFYYLFAASSASELPSVLLCAYAIDVFGRRWLACGMLIINSTACVLIIFVTIGWANAACAVVARFAINISINTAIQWSAEILPTPVRGSGVSFVIICGNLAIMMSPFISYLKHYSDWLPFLVMASLACMGAVLAFYLPETVHKEMPNTFDDAENLAKNKHLWQLPPCFNKTKKQKEGSINPGFSMS